MKILSWNVNGIRAAEKKGFLDWLTKQKADFVCIQETKAHKEQLEEKLIHPASYESYWFSAQKKGYSSVACYTKSSPLEVHYGMGIEAFDIEGRVLSLEYSDFVLINAYFPNSQDLGKRLDYKLDFCQAMLHYCQEWRQKGKHIILCGDYNIAHKEIDLKRPQANQQSAGFLPEEREWMSQYLSHGYIDIFREFEPGPDHYTWWSYRAGARPRNVGWRIDYFTCNPEMKDKLLSCTHQTKVMGSDHCPIELNIKS
ncbi:MAG: exodeoxyribonuclease III [Bdellovibrionales bacterium]|nr:exodeoxyribonuclease III [Bdellovibrionales bacterium]